MQLALFIGGGVAILILVIALVIVAEKRRREAFRQVARELGFEYQDRVDGVPHAGMERLRLFNRGYGRRSHNIMSGRYSRVSMTLFDYRYVTGAGKNRKTHRQTVAAFPLEGIFLPVFTLGPENIFHRLISSMGFQDIDFEHAPAFSAKYLLRGEDEYAVRALFEDKLLHFFENTEGWCVEGGDQWLIVYRARRRRVSPQDVSGFLDEAVQVRSAFIRK